MSRILILSLVMAVAKLNCSASSRCPFTQTSPNPAKLMQDVAGPLDFVFVSYGPDDIRTFAPNNDGEPPYSYFLSLKVRRGGAISAEWFPYCKADGIMEQVFRGKVTQLFLNDRVLARDVIMNARAPMATLVNRLGQDVLEREGQSALMYLHTERNYLRLEDSANVLILDRFDIVSGACDGKVFSIQCLVKQIKEKLEKGRERKN